jgi:hypothetical protein
VKCVRLKHEIGEVVIGVLKRWERQTDRVVKILRTDRGTEFMGILREFVENKGIERQFIAPYVPEQNGRAERLNRTLIERCRALLFERKLPKIMRPDAMRAAAYIRNRTLGVHAEKTPIERFYSMKPSVRQLRIFVCMCYVHKPSHMRDKFDPVTEDGLFLGYVEGSKSWQVTVRREGQFIIMESSNVVFDEGKHSVLIESLIKGEEEGEAESSEDEEEWLREVDDGREAQRIGDQNIREPEHHDERDSQTDESVGHEDGDIKRNERGSIERYKARIVAKGFRQVAGRDYDEVFAPTAQDASFRILLWRRDTH